MGWYHVEKEFWDSTDGIEAVNIHYAWTPLGETPDWDAQRLTRFMPPSDPDDPVGGRLRRKVLRLPDRIPDPASGGETDHFLLHHYFEIFEQGARRYSERYSEEVRTGAGTGPPTSRRGRRARGGRRPAAPVGVDVGARGTSRPAVGALETLCWFDDGTGRRVAYRGPLRGPDLTLRYAFDGWRGRPRHAALEEVEPGLAVTGPLDVAGHLTVDAAVTDGDRWDNNRDVDYRLWVTLEPVDSHLHASGPGSGPFGSASLEAALASAGMVAGVVSWFDNRATARLRRPGGRLYPLVWVRPGSTPEAEVADRLANGFVGIKLHPTLDDYRADDPALDPYLEIAAEAGCPVASHSAPGDADPRHIADLAARHPSVPVILYHTYLGPSEGRRRAARYVADQPNLYLETSWCRWRTVLKLVEAVGADRVLFGSDASVDGPAHYRRQPPNVEGKETYNDGVLSLVKALGADAAGQVMTHNTRRLFRLDAQDSLRE